MLDLTTKILREERGLQLLFTPGKPFVPSAHAFEDPLKRRGITFKMVQETPVPAGMEPYCTNYLHALNHLDDASNPPAWREEDRDAVKQDLEHVSVWWKALQQNALTPLQHQIAVNGLRNRLAILAGICGGDSVDYDALIAAITTRRTLLAQPRPAGPSSSSAIEPPTDLLVALLGAAEEMLRTDQTMHLLFQPGERIATIPGNESLMPVPRKRKPNKAEQTQQT